AVINSINESPANLSNTLIKENLINGGNGLGIEILNASGNTIIDNSINTIRKREPFPGDYVNSSNPVISGWEEYNGSGIWISRSSSLKKIKNNTFSDIENQSIVIEKPK
ncbi:MAG: right-handed parallel beta-helix repeat-containing protein, partial [Kangiella sp.]|nr:right-handed parallel beta-helix repeat-containing protein [Kangiella sp.]